MLLVQFAEEIQPIFDPVRRVVVDAVPERVQPEFLLLDQRVLLLLCTLELAQQRQNVVAVHTPVVAVLRLRTPRKNLHTNFDL